MPHQTVPLKKSEKKKRHLLFKINIKYPIFNVGLHVMYSLFNMLLHFVEKVVVIHHWECDYSVPF